MAEERRALPPVRCQAEQLGVERIGQISRAAARLERVGRSVKRGPLFTDERLPRVFVSVRARAGERQVREV